MLSKVLSSLTVGLKGVALSTFSVQKSAAFYRRDGESNFLLSVYFCLFTIRRILGAAWHFHQGGLISRHDIFLTTSECSGLFLGKRSGQAVHVERAVFSFSDDSADIV